MTRHGDVFGGVEQAWREFRSDLADRIAEGADCDYLLWEVDVPERHVSPCGPYAQVEGIGGGIVAEVSSNRVLDPKFRIRKDGRRRLLEAGWQRPDEEHLNYWLPINPAYADKAAVMIVAAFRDVFGVVHPAFLVDGVADPAELQDVEETGDEGTAAGPEIVTPSSHEHLVDLVDRALQPDWAHPIPHDDDGDIPYGCGTSVVYVRVLEDRPVVRVFAELVVGATNVESATIEVNILNRDQPEAKFALFEGVIRMWIDVPASPFAPQHLRATVKRMCELAPRLDGDLARRVGGTRFLEPSDGDTT